MAELVMVVSRVGVWKSLKSEILCKMETILISNGAWRYKFEAQNPIQIQMTDFLRLVEHLEP